MVFTAESGIRHKTVWLRWHLPGNFADERFLQQSIGGSGIYPTVPELSKMQLGCGGKGRRLSIRQPRFG